MHPLDNAIDEVDDDGRHPSLSWHSVDWLDLGWEGPRSGEDNDDEDDIEDWSDDARHDIEDDIISAYFLFSLLCSRLHPDTAHSQLWCYKLPVC